MKMLAALISTIVLLISHSVVAQDGPELTSYVYIMNADGSDQRPLFPYPIRATGLAISPDGTRIAYSGSGHRGSDIWVSDFEGDNAVNLTNTSGVMEFNPSWSPDGSRIVYGTRDKDFSTEIFVIDTDGSNVMNLTNHPAGDIGPSWSPEGNHIAFSSEREGTGQIFVMNSDGSGIRNKSNDFVENVHYLQPDWSPDSNRIAYVAIFGPERHIYLRNVTGDPPQALATDTTTAEHPSWSPDGTRIAFTSNLVGVRDIFVMNPGGQEVVNLTRGVGINEHPTWTPDGRIVYASRRTSEELEEIDLQFLGPDTVLTILEEGGLSIGPRTGNTPPVRLRRKNASGGIEYIPLSRGEAERLLRQRGDTRVKLDKLYKGEE